MSDKIIENQYYNFRGLFDKDDSGLIPSSPESGVFASAIQNANCEDGTISFDFGYEEENDGTTPTTHYNGSDETFIRNEVRLKKRDGTIINVCQLNNGKLEWLNKVANRYETLLTGLTVGANVGFQDFNKTDQDRTYLCDGINNLSFWNKAIAYYASDNSSDQITVTVPNSTHTTLTQAGFDSSGSIILKDGTEITYSGISNLTFTGCNAVPSIPTIGDGIAQKVDMSTLSSAPKGNIIFKYQGRLGVLVESSPTVVYLSKVADGSDFTSTGVDGRIILNIIDGDGRITGIIPFKKKLVVLKEGGIIQVSIEQLDSTTLRSSIEPLIISENVGPNNFGQIISGINEIYWISDAEKDIKTLSNVGEENDINLTTSQLTTSVRQTMESFTMSSSRMMINNGDAYFTAQSENSNELDTLARYDSDNKTFYFYKIPAYNFWYDNENRLHFTDPYRVKSYRIFSGYDADGGSLSYLWKSGRLNFGTNFYKKGTNLMGIFGKMTDSSILKCRIDYNNGALGVLEWTINGDGSSITNGKYILESDPSNPYGQYPYGIKPYGGENSKIKTNYFLFFKSLPSDFNPYDAYISFSADGDSNLIKIISFGLNPKTRQEISKYRRK